MGVGKTGSASKHIAIKERARGDSRIHTCFALDDAWLVVWVEVTYVDKGN